MKTSTNLIRKTFIGTKSTFILFSVMAAISNRAAEVWIHFDEHLTVGDPPYVQGHPVPPEALVHDDYLHRGVRFDSGGGGIAIAYVGPFIGNAATGTGPGPVISYQDAVYATFFIEGVPAVVDFVSLNLPSTSSSALLTAFDANGGMLGSATGVGLATLQVRFPQRIHSVELTGQFGFDNFRFNGLMAVPEPTTSLLLVLASLGLVAAEMRRRRKIPLIPQPEQFEVKVKEELGEIPDAASSGRKIPSTWHTDDHSCGHQSHGWYSHKHATQPKPPHASGPCT